MGCGSSTASAVGGLSKDADDLYLDPIQFKKMKVPEFDDFLIGKVTPVVNKVVTIVNELNGCVDNIKDAAAVLQGAFKVDVETGNERDAIILALQKADGTWPTAAEVTALDASAVAADKTLTKARKALETQTESTYAKLEVVEDKLSSEAPPAGMEGFNAALAALRTAVGDAYKVVLVVKHAGAGGTESVRADLEVPVFATPDANATWEPVGVLTMAKSKSAKAIFAAQQSVATALSKLNAPVKVARDAGVVVAFELQGRKVVAVMTGGEEKEEPSDDSDERKADEKAFEKADAAKDSVRKAVSAVNQQLFKLFKYARNAAGDVNLAKAVVILVEAVRTKAMSIAKTAGKDAAGSVLKFSPKLDFGLDGVEFDLGLGVNLDGYEDMDTAATIAKLLPGTAKLVYTAIMAMIAHVKDKLIPDFKELAELVEELISTVGDVFSDPTDKITAAFGGSTDDMFAIPKAAANAAMNAKTVAVEPIQILNTFKNSIVMIKDEFSASFVEIKAIAA
ncbi:hypothetical protein FOA52_005858 [Chlamydomonas sp. UWO 241]|nr:hypothetical protein FOA52_005858 [Chlamydomonas sp. UWO 241]